MSASSLQQIINYANAANFSFDSNLIEFTGAIAKLKQLINPSETAYNNFATKDLFRAVGGNLTGTLAGVAAVSSGRLSIPGNAIGDWQFDPTGMLGADPRVGAIRFKYIPLYSGTPPNIQDIMTEQDTPASAKNQIFICHNAAGSLVVTFRDNIGAGEGSLVAIPNWSPIAGQIYEFELNFDMILGTQKFYLNGANVGPDHGRIFARDTVINVVRCGQTTTNSNFEIDDYQRFGAQIHAANFTSEVPRVVPLTKFSIVNPTIINNSGVLGDALDGFIETLSNVVAPDALQYIINLSGQDKYWDGAAWANSDGTFTQSNPATVIETNKAALDLSLGGTIKVKVFFHSDDGSSTPEIETVTLDYNFFNTQNDPATTTVWGFYRDVSGKGVEGATVTFKLVRANKQYREAGDSIIEKSLSTLTDVNGRFEMDLIRTSEFEHVGNTYEIAIVKATPDDLDTSVLDATAAKIQFNIPDLADVNITDLITAVS